MIAQRLALLLLVASPAWAGPASCQGEECIPSKSLGSVEIQDAEETQAASSMLLQTSAMLPPVEVPPAAVPTVTKEVPQVDTQPQAVDDGLVLFELGLSASTAPVEFRKCAAEFLAMTMFVIIGCGSAMSVNQKEKEDGNAWVLQVSLTFGLAITVLAYSIGHYSGGQINCAVTLGLWVSGNLGIAQAVLNVVAQLLGSVFGAVILKVMYPAGMDSTGGLGTNKVAAGWTQGQALIGEFMGTFLLVWTVIETAINPLSAANRVMACVAIGFSVFLAHSVLIPVDGCSINPTRTFGPALVEGLATGSLDAWRDMWVFWIGPMGGAAAAAGIHVAISYPAYT